MDIKGNRIIAVDFDGTLHTGTWPEIGEVNTTVFNFCRNEQLNGSRLILWTNRTGKQLEDAVAWCKERGLEFDTVNENLPELIELYGNDCRKINADIYRRQSSKSNEKTADCRTYIVKPIRQPDRPRSIHRNTENERSRKKGI